MPVLETSVEASQYGVDKQTPLETAVKHYNGWPNEAAFHATTETQIKRQLLVTGKFPSYAAGRLFRTGPQASKAGDFPLSHWFDGFAMIHRFDLVHDEASDEVKVQYAARCQVDHLIEEARKTKALAGLSFGQKRDPCDSYFKKVKSVFHAANPQIHPNVSVAIQRKPNASSNSILTATTDSQLTQDFDPATLEPMGVTNQQKLHPDLTGPLSGAHAAFDPVTGDIFNYNLLMGPKATYRIFKTDATTGATEILATVSEKSIPCSYIHSMFITANFLILCVWPAYFAGMGINILWEQNLLDAMKFDPKASSQWLVVDRRHGNGLVKRFTSPAFFAFHSTNAFEIARSDGSVDIKCEVVQFSNMDILQKLYYKNLVSSSPDAVKFSAPGRSPSLVPSLVRYNLAGISMDLSRSKSSKVTKEAATVEFTHSVAGELPTINAHYATKAHRYVYGVADTGIASFVDSLVKTDTRTGEGIYWRIMKHSPGEPIFLPRPAKDGETRAEDDGVLLSVVLDGPKETSYLLCLDARDMTEIARAEVGSPVGIGFHGIFLEAGN